jgi:2-dehydropantoate 2-reductase
VRFLRVGVIGAGTIGSLCAAHLATQAETWVVVRRKEQADLLNEKGLQITGKSELVADVRAVVDTAEVPDLDLCIVATKASQVNTAVAAMGDRCPGAVFMTIQNGLGVEDVVRRHGSWPIVSAVTFMSGTRIDDRHVEYELDTPTWMGPYRPSGIVPAAVEEVGRLFENAGLRAEVLPDLRPAQWSKLIFNSAVNGLSSLTDLPHVALFARRDRDTDLGHVVYDLMAEGKAVAEASGVELWEDPWKMNVEAVSRGSTQDEDYAHVPSMLADIRAGRPTEVDFITGALVREADRLEVPVPLSRALYCMVKARDRSYDEEA